MNSSRISAVSNANKHAGMEGARAKDTSMTWLRPSCSSTALGIHPSILKHLLASSAVRFSSMALAMVFFLVLPCASSPNPRVMKPSSHLSKTAFRSNRSHATCRKIRSYKIYDKISIIESVRKVTLCIWQEISCMETACACTNYQFTGFTGKPAPCVSEQRKLSDRNLKCAKIIISQLTYVFVIDLLFPDAHVRYLANDIEQCKT